MNVVVICITFGPKKNVEEYTPAPSGEKDEFRLDQFDIISEENITNNDKLYLKITTNIDFDHLVVSVEPHDTVVTQYEIGLKYLQDDIYELSLPTYTKLADGTYVVDDLILYDEDAHFITSFSRRHSDNVTFTIKNIDYSTYSPDDYYDYDQKNRINRIVNFLTNVEDDNVSTIIYKLLNGEGNLSYYEKSALAIFNAFNNQQTTKLDDTTQSELSNKYGTIVSYKLTYEKYEKVYQYLFGETPNLENIRLGSSDDYEVCPFAIAKDNKLNNIYLSIICNMSRRGNKTLFTKVNEVTNDENYFYVKTTTVIQKDNTRADNSSLIIYNLRWTFDKNYKLINTVREDNNNK